MLRVSEVHPNVMTTKPERNARGRSWGVKCGLPSRMHREAEACQHDRSNMSRCLVCSSEQREEPSLCGACGHRIDATFVTLWPEPAVNAAPSSQASLRGGLISEFEERAARNVQERPAAVDFLIGLADDLMRERRLHEARHLLDRVVAEAPAEFTVRLRRGECLAALGLYREALMDLERARVLPARDLKQVTYYRELHRWVGEQMTRKQLLSKSTTDARTRLQPPKHGVRRWLGR